MGCGRVCSIMLAMLDRSASLSTSGGAQEGRGPRRAFDAGLMTISLRSAAVADVGSEVEDFNQLFGLF